MRVISAVGCDEFNDSIRQLATSFAEIKHGVRNSFGSTYESVSKIVRISSTKSMRRTMQRFAFSPSKKFQTISSASGESDDESIQHMSETNRTPSPTLPGRHVDLAAPEISRPR